MGTMASQITSFIIVYSTVYSGADQRKHQSSASLAFVRGTHRGPVNSPHKWSVARKMVPFDDAIRFYHHKTGKESKTNISTTSRQVIFLSPDKIDHIWHGRYKYATYWWFANLRSEVHLTLMEVSSNRHLNTIHENRQCLTDETYWYGPWDRLRIIVIYFVLG